MEVVMKRNQALGSTQVSRRMLLAAGVAAGSAALLATSDANATVRLSKSTVRFSTVSSNGKNCGSCKLFLAPSDCVFVEGPVLPDCTCWIWRGKTA
jgi:hypothetical protein